MLRILEPSRIPHVREAVEEGWRRFFAPIVAAQRTAEESLLLLSAGRRYSIISDMPSTTLRVQSLQAPASASFHPHHLGPVRSMEGRAEEAVRAYRRYTLRCPFNMTGQKPGRSEKVPVHYALSEPVSRRKRHSGKLLFKRRTIPLHDIIENCRFEVRLSPTVGPYVTFGT